MVSAGQDVTHTAALRSDEDSALRPRQWLEPLAILVAFAGFAALVSLIFWPGHMDPDTLAQREQAATGDYTDWYAPILSALWRGPYALGLQSTGWILALGAFTLLVGLYLVLRVRLSRPSSAIVAMLIVAYPPVLAWAVHVGRDAWFAALLLCAFGSAARAARTQGRARTVSIAAALVFAFFAGAARQNALPALLVLFTVLAALLLPHRVRRRSVLAVGAGVAATLILFVGQTAIVRWVLDATPLHGEQATFIYDLALMSKDQNRVLLPRDVYLQQDISQIEKLATPQTVDHLLFSADPIVRIPLTGRAYESLRDAWGSAILDDPVGYLRVRLRAGAGLMAIDRPSFWVYQHPPAPPEYSPAFPMLHQKATDYLNLSTVERNNLNGGPLYTVWIYVLALIGMAFVLARRAGPDRIVAGLAVGAVLYLAVLVFVAPGWVYRYAYPVVVVGTVIALMLVPAAIAKLRVAGAQAGRATRQTVARRRATEAR